MCSPESVVYFFKVVQFITIRIDVFLRDYLNLCHLCAKICYFQTVDKGDVTHHLQADGSEETESKSNCLDFLCNTSLELLHVNHHFTVALV